MIGKVAIRIAEVDSVGVKRRTQRTAGVARGWRDEDTFETRLRKDACVGDTVQRHAPSQAEV